MRPIDGAALVGLIILSAGFGVAWARSPATDPGIVGRSPATIGPSNSPEPSPSPSPLPPCTADLIVNAMVHDQEVLGNARPYAVASPTAPAPETGVQFDLPQQFNPRAPAYVLVYKSVADRVRAQFAFPESDTVGGSGRLIWSLDSVAPTYAAPYKLTLSAITARNLPCGEPEN